MLLELRPGIDDRDLALPDHIGAGALEGERAGVLRDDPADPRRHRFEPAVFESDLAAKRNIDSHGGFASGWISRDVLHSRPGLSSELRETEWPKERPHEDQVRDGVHTRGVARLLRPHQRPGEAGETLERGRGADACQSAGARSGDDAEDLAAGRT